MVAESGDGRLVATAHAGGAQHTDPGADPRRQILKQFFSAHHFAGDAVADPDGHRRRGVLWLEHHIEMRIKRSRLVNFGQGEAHLMGERGQVVRRQKSIGILNQMEMFDQ